MASAPLLAGKYNLFVNLSLDIKARLVVKFDFRKHLVFFFRVISVLEILVNIFWHHSSFIATNLIKRVPGTTSQGHMKACCC
jgi:hypothetical protein